MYLLPKIAAWVTQSPREIVQLGTDFEWNPELWTHNVFRVVEMLFGRRVGIRPGTSVAASRQQTVVYFHSIEDVFAHIEVRIRAFLQRIPVPQFVFLPQFATVGGPFKLPYMFAVAFDSATPAGSPPKTAALTWSHTITGANPTIVLGIGMNAALTTSPTAKYNSVSMTAGSIANQTTSWAGTFYLANPATGVGTAEADDSVATEWANCSLSLTGTTASPSSPGTNSAVGTSASPSVAVTTTVDNSFVVTYFWCTNATAGTTTTGTNQTSRTTAQDLDSGFSAAISTQTTTTAGSYTSGWTITVALWLISGTEVQPGAAAATVIYVPQLLTLGVG